MTFNRDLAPTFLPDPPSAVLVAERSTPMTRPPRPGRDPRPRRFGRGARCPQSPGATNAVTIGHLAVTRVPAFDVPKPAPIDSIAVHSASPNAPAPTVLLYRRGALRTGGAGRGHYAVPAQSVLRQPVLSKPVVLGLRSA